jgi:GNAT superfamily N-acetyltransferase
MRTGCGNLAAMDVQIREYRPADEDAVVALSIRAWAPVFASLEQVLGGEMCARLHGDWQRYQENAVRGVLGDAAMHAWVAEAGRRAIGFVAATLHQERLLGEIAMVAVDPASQHRGVGTVLTTFATTWLCQSGMRVAMVETGGDPGHAAARRLYEKAGYAPLPVVRYFRNL